MIQKSKHLYIHIPFCKSICTYCDFVRFVKNQQDVTTYVHKIISEVTKKCTHHQFQTIYIGGGTPNSLTDDLLAMLTRTVSKYLERDNYEFTIECNPELLTTTQCAILKANKVNRVSIGVQTTNNTLLQKFQRQHTLNDVKQAIDNLQKVGIGNIAIDLMYGFNELQNKDIKAAGELIKTMHIPHVSWYALEVKPGSMLYQQQYPLHDECIETQLQSIIQLMHELGYQRYEVSNWCKSSRCESLHNKAYWLTQDWKAIGLGSCGFENQTYYENVGTIKHWTMHKNRYTKYDYYFQIMLMGLRLQTGLCLSHRPYKAAYKYFKNKLKYVHIEDNHLVVDNLNLLDNTLIDLM